MSQSDIELRGKIVAEARAWLGTPYRHQASLKGAGCDCFGLVRGVWRAVCGPEPEAVPPYSRDWGSVTGKEALVATARRHMQEIDVATIAPGDVVVFRMRRGLVAKHCGIVTETTPPVARCNRSPHGAERNAGRAIPDFSDAASGLRTSPGATRFAHAQEHMPVSEAALSDWWRRRIVAAFAFPGTGS